ncbi:TIGR03618 family F420-dependent PPOX class oxidoreductase [Embleya sp. NPDC001921]
MIDRFLHEANPAVVGTVRPDGSPATTPTWYGWEGDHLLLSMTTTSPRTRNVRLQPRISLTVLAESWYDHVTLYGTVLGLRDDPELRDLDTLSHRYFGHAYPKRGLSCVSAIVEIERWHAWGSPGGDR